jgi:hypothetical protein
MMMTILEARESRETKGVKLHSIQSRERVDIDKRRVLMERQRNVCHKITHPCRNTIE